MLPTALLAIATTIATQLASPPLVTVTAIPSHPYVEQRSGDQALSVDLIVHNVGPQPLRLVAIRERVSDRRGELEQQREINANGTPSALAGLGDLIVQPGAYKDVFLPFEHYRATLELARVRLTLIFLQPERAIPPVALSGDAVVQVELRPQSFHPPAYCVPLDGEILVHDGHDLASHHRRRDLARLIEASPAAAVNANLYAYDFVRIGSDGELYSGTPDSKEHWLSFGAPILAPTRGQVIEAVDGVPDNSFVDAAAVIPDSAQQLDPNGLGNHVLIRAPDGRISWLLHMQSGSVTVRVGQQVAAGAQLGRIGFSGDALFPHLHYTVTQTSAYPSQGVPSYFANFHRIVGHRRIAASYGQLDTGELLIRDHAAGCGG